MYIQSSWYVFLSSDLSFVFFHVLYLPIYICNGRWPFYFLRLIEREEMSKQISCDRKFSILFFQHLHRPSLHSFSYFYHYSSTPMTARRQVFARQVFTPTQRTPPPSHYLLVFEDTNSYQIVARSSLKQINGDDVSIMIRNKLVKAKSVYYGTVYIL